MHCVNGACEFDQHAIVHQLDDTAIVFLRWWDYKLVAMRLVASSNFSSWLRLSKKTVPTDFAQLSFL